MSSQIYLDYYEGYSWQCLNSTCNRRHLSTKP